MKKKYKGKKMKNIKYLKIIILTYLMLITIFSINAKEETKCFIGPKFLLNVGFTDYSFRNLQMPIDFYDNFSLGFGLSLLTLPGKYFGDQALTFALNYIRIHERSTINYAYSCNLLVKLPGKKTGLYFSILGLGIEFQKDLFHHNKYSFNTENISLFSDYTLFLNSNFKLGFDLYDEHYNKYLVSFDLFDINLGIPVLTSDSHLHNSPLIVYYKAAHTQNLVNFVHFIFSTVSIQIQSAISIRFKS